MSTSHDAYGAENAKDRIWLPLILPLAAAAITAALIVVIGITLLAFNTELFTVGEEHIVAPVFIALGMTVGVLIAAAIVARVWAKDEE